MKKQRTKYYILLLLAVMFATPGIAAYLLYQHPGWVGATKVNKGALLSPPIKLNSLHTQSKWQIIFWTPDTCKRSCLKQLDLLARVRLALGRKLYQVDQRLILGDEHALVTEQMKSMLKERDFHITRLSIDDKMELKALSSAPQIFIANPDNFLILSYQPWANPDDVYKDLKLLLSTTEKKSG